MEERRRQIMRDLIGADVPRLWCPPLTHYAADGSLDRGRIAAHWAWMAADARGFLVPGSTGDGWEMSEAEIDSLLDLALELAPKLDVILLVGVLKTDAAAMVAAIRRILAMLQRRSGAGEAVAALKQSRVCGFTVCPPRGAALTQAEIRAGLESVLELGVPVSLYQLPQVTQNEMSPALFARLAGKYPHLLLLKDTSGKDRVPLADNGRSGVFLVRGAEGDYARWLKESGGPYDGLLLSTANGFAREYGRVIADLAQGRIEAARSLSERLTRVVKSVFDAVAGVRDGNAFTNANKALDHFMAYGASALQRPTPRLHAGSRLPVAVLATVGGILADAGLLPASGYWT